MKQLSSIPNFQHRPRRKDEDSPDWKKDHPALRPSEPWPDPKPERKPDSKPDPKPDFKPVEP